MEIQLVGFERPYTSQKNGRTYYKVGATWQDQEGYDKSMPLDCTEKAFFALKALGKGTRVRVGLSLSIFAGKVGGVTVVDVYGVFDGLTGELQAA